MDIFGGVPKDFLRKLFTIVRTGPEETGGWLESWWLKGEKEQKTTDGRNKTLTKPGLYSKIGQIQYRAIGNKVR